MGTYLLSANSSFVVGIFLYKVKVCYNVALSLGSWKWGLKTSPELYQAFGNDEKRML